VLDYASESHHQQRKLAGFQLFVTAVKLAFSPSQCIIIESA